ncbi:MAG: hypothetical protein LBI80_04355 [Endomicrobium sp.]|jgi:hypothetical protein|nr:hypothetical protein [Endomicrobium sp.]
MKKIACRFVALSCILSLCLCSPSFVYSDDGIITDIGKTVINKVVETVLKKEDVLTWTAFGFCIGMVVQIVYYNARRLIVRDRCYFCGAQRPHNAQVQGQAEEVDGGGIIVENQLMEEGDAEV